MNNETQHGYLVLADISGYTSYLAGVELTSAREMNRGGLPPGTFVTAMAQPIRDSHGPPLRSE
jgi:hypothetical protein